MDKAITAIKAALEELLGEESPADYYRQIISLCKDLCAASEDEAKLYIAKNILSLNKASIVRGQGFFATIIFLQDLTLFEHCVKSILEYQDVYEKYDGFESSSPLNNRLIGDILDYAINSYLNFNRNIKFAKFAHALGDGANRKELLLNNKYGYHKKIASSSSNYANVVKLLSCSISENTLYYKLFRAMALKCLYKLELADTLRLILRGDIITSDLEDLSSVALIRNLMQEVVEALSGAFESLDRKVRLTISKSLNKVWSEEIGAYLRGSAEERKAILILYPVLTRLQGLILKLELTSKERLTALSDAPGLTVQEHLTYYKSFEGIAGGSALGAGGLVVVGKRGAGGTRRVHPL